MASGRRVLALILVLMTALAGCGLKPAADLSKERPPHPLPNPKVVTWGEAGRPGGTFVYYNIIDPKTFNPVVAKESNSSVVIGLMFDGLTEMNGITYQVEPALAERWTIEPDGRTFTFYLRKGLQWSDGEPVTADDVIFTFQVLYDPNIPNPAADILRFDGKPIAVAKIDDRTVRMVCPIKFARFLQDAAGTAILPKHVLEPFYKNGSFNSTWGVNVKLSTIVGTGPFIVTEFKSGERVILRKNPYYWKVDAAGQRLPYLDYFVFAIVPTADTAVLKFKVGELDLVDYGPRLARFVDAIKAEQHDVTLVAERNYGISFIVFNLNPAKAGAAKFHWFSNKLFRQAVSYGIDRDAINRIVYMGMGDVITGVENPSSPFYNPHVRTYPHDPGKARALLQQAGFTWRGAQLVDDQGHPVVFRMYEYPNPGLHVMSSMVKQDLEQLGIQVQPSVLDFNTITTKMDTGDDWDAAFMGFTSGPDPHGLKDLWESNASLHLWYPSQKTPATAWEAAINRIFMAAEREMDPAKRKALYWRWQEIAAEECPLVLMVRGPLLVAYRSEWINVHPTTFGQEIHNVYQFSRRP